MTYDYQCQACGHEWEAEQKITEDALKTCPSCGKPEAQRMISGGTRFILTGSCWASDNYSK